MANEVIFDGKKLSELILEQEISELANEYNSPSGKKLLEEGWADLGGLITRPSDWFHLALDVAGVVPGLGMGPDLLNMVWYIAEGRLILAGFSAFAAIPGFGWLAPPLKIMAAGGKVSARALQRAAHAFPGVATQIVRMGNRAAPGAGTSMAKAVKKFLKEGIEAGGGKVPAVGAGGVAARETAEKMMKGGFGDLTQTGASKIWTKGGKEVAIQKIGKEALARGATMAQHASKMAKAGAKIEAKAIPKINDLITKISRQHAARLFGTTMTPKMISKTARNEWRLIRKLKYFGANDKTINLILKQTGSPTTMSTARAALKSIRVAHPAAKEVLAKWGPSEMAKWGARIVGRGPYAVVKYYTVTAMSTGLDGEEHVTEIDPFTEEDEPSGGAPEESPTGAGRCATVLRRGCSGENVEKLQKDLTSLNYGNLLGTSGPNGDGIDGQYGSKTKEAVDAFQTSTCKKSAESMAISCRGECGNCDGKAGPETLAEIAKALKEGETPGTATPEEKPAEETPTEPTEKKPKTADEIAIADIDKAYGGKASRADMLKLIRGIWIAESRGQKSMAYELVKFLIDKRRIEPAKAFWDVRSALINDKKEDDEDWNWEKASNNAMTKLNIAPDRWTGLEEKAKYNVDRNLKGHRKEGGPSSLFESKQKKNVFTVLQEHKQSAHNNTFEKLIKNISN